MFALSRSVRPYLLLFTCLPGLAFMMPACNPPVPGPTDFDVQGHRGARGERPENSLPAFRHAMQLGVSTLEMDVVVSADSHLVVSHEAWMSELICSYPDGTPVSADSARSLNLFRMTYAEIARFDCGKRVHPAFPGQRPEPVAKPLLATLLDSVAIWAVEFGRPGIRFNIETKSSPDTDGLYHPPPQDFVHLLHALLGEKGVLDRVTIQSFDVRTLQVLRKLDPEVQTSLLVPREGRWEDRLASLGFVPEILSPSWGHVNRAMVDSVHALGAKVIPWTVNESADMVQLLSAGIDGLITDYPTRALSILNPGGGGISDPG